MVISILMLTLLLITNGINTKMAMGMKLVRMPIPIPRLILMITLRIVLIPMITPIQMGMTMSMNNESWLNRGQWTRKAPPLPSKCSAGR